MIQFEGCYYLNLYGGKSMKGIVKSMLLFLSGCLFTLFLVRAFSEKTYYENPYINHSAFIESNLKDDLDKLLKNTRKEVLERLKKELCEKGDSDLFEI